MTATREEKLMRAKRAVVFLAISGALLGGSLAVFGPGAYDGF